MSFVFIGTALLSGLASVGCTGGAGFAAASAASRYASVAGEGGGDESPELESVTRAQSMCEPATDRAISCQHGA